ncbi:MAG: hypothetical protein JO138_08720 [Acidobacteriaceae bacterium]|nr:hypothetical protein [Acidobacteriaceae bacterium]
MSARSIRRAQERRAKKLARKAEQTALLQNRDCEGAAAAALTEPNPELLDEFTPEFIAEANAVRDRVWRKAGLLPASAPSASEPRASASGHVSPAQLAANRANSQLSTGPRSSAGKETVSFNAFRHGLTGRFKIMPYESEQDYEELLKGLREEHRPSTPTEHLLIDRMAEHHWLSQRALYLQGFCFNEVGGCDNDAHLALYLRYQTTHQRAFHKCLNDLLKLRAQKRKEQSGFVSQQHKQADQGRREARDKRQQERHKWAVLMDSAKVDHQNLLNLQLPGGEQFVEKAIQRIIALEKAA